MNNAKNTHKIATPYELALKINHTLYKFPKHLEFLQKEILNAINSDNPRIVVNMPPRHGKSEYISKYFPAWYLGIYPSKRIILSSYCQQFAEFWGRQVLEILEEYGEEFFHINISKKAKSAKRFEIQRYKGSMNCAGALGSLTGKGADLLIIDDPIKNDREANSLNARNNLWEWFRATAMTRLEPKGALIIVMTRWHEDDLSGRIIKEYFDDWNIIKLPAIATVNDALGRKIGEALWEERYDIKSLNNIKKNLGSYWFSSLYQQEPLALTGEIFKRQWFSYYYLSDNIFVLECSKPGIQNLPSYAERASLRIYSTVDLATSTKETSDYTVILTFGLTSNNDILILDIFRAKFDSSEHINMLLSAYNKWHPKIIGIESVQYQISLLKSALKLGLPVKELKATKDKISRALPMATKLENGKVFFPKDARWLDAFEAELLSFPNGNKDDQVDAFSYISDMIEPISGINPIGRINNNKVRKY